MIRPIVSPRRLGGALVAATTALAAVALGFAGSAAANAPNPASRTDASVSTNGDGTVTVTISGTWDWGNVTTEADEGTSPQKDCTGRYGVGWAVDWQDASAFPWSDPATAKKYTISKKDVSFTAGPDYDGFQVGLCQYQDADGFPMGPWSAQHTYPNANAVPAELCVNFYDPHGKENQPSGGVGWPDVNNISPDKRSSDFVAAGPHHDGDNSVETNSYDPATDGGNCAVPHPADSPAPPPPPPPAPPAAAPPAAPATPPAAPAAAPAPGAPAPPAAVLGESIARSPVAQAVPVQRITFTG